jgi:hypothetical protein
VFPPFDPLFRAKPAELLVNAASRASKKMVFLGSGTKSYIGFLHCVGVTFDNVRTYETHRRLAQERSPKTNWIEANRDALVSALDMYHWNSGSLPVISADETAMIYTVKSRWPGDLFPIKVRDDSVEQVTEDVSE